MTTVTLVAQLTGTGGGGAGTVSQINGVSPDGTGLVTLSKANIGLGNVDNTADASKSFTASQISNASTIGRTVLTAADAAAVRAATGAGTSSLAIGTTSSTAKAGDYQPTAANISDSTTIGRSVLTAASTAAARTAIGAGTSSLVIGTTSGTAADAALVATGLGAKADDSAVVHQTDSIPYVRRYSSGVWPVRGTIPAGSIAQWIGPTAPPIDGTYALAGVDTYLVTVS